MSTEEEVGELLKQCYKVWQIARAAQSSINPFFEKEGVAKAIEEDPRLQIIISGLLSGEDIEVIGDNAQMENLKEVLENEKIEVKCQHIK